jgi:hypothetical protein
MLELECERDAAQQQVWGVSCLVSVLGCMLRVANSSSMSTELRLRLQLHATSKKQTSSTTGYSCGKLHAWGGDCDCALSSSSH